MGGGGLQNRGGKKGVLIKSGKKPAFPFAKREGEGPSRVLLENPQISGCPECGLEEPLPVPQPGCALETKSGFRGFICLVWFGFPK